MIVIGRAMELSRPHSSMSDRFYGVHTFFTVPGTVPDMKPLGP